MVLKLNRERILNLNLNLTLSMVKNQSKVEYTQKSCIHFVEVNYNYGVSYMINIYDDANK